MALSMSSGFSLWKWASTTPRLRSTICSGVSVVVMVLPRSLVLVGLWRSGGGGGLDAQVVAEDVLASEFGGISGEDHPASSEDVGVVGDGECLVDVLLHEKERDVLLADPVEELEDLVDDDR